MEQNQTTSFSFYWKLYAAAVKSRTEYRVDFLINVATAVTMQMAALGFFWVIFHSTGQLGGWGTTEVLLLFGLTAVSIALTELCLNGIWMLPFYIVNGELDRLMVYPVRGLLFLLVSRPELHALGNLGAGIAMIVVAGSKMALPPEQWAMLPFWALCGTISYAALLVGLACISFFAVGPWSNPMMVGFHVHNASRYPLHIYPSWLKFFLTFVYPAGLSIYLPVQYLKGEAPVWQAIVFPAAAAVLCVWVSLGIWNFSLKRYQSTGS
jgi:ABC-2 type transport system permease protein